MIPIPTTHSSAGVYLREFNQSQNLPVALGTVGAMVGPSNQGPVLERTLITSTKDFLETFGPPVPQTSKMHYAALEFLKQSNSLFVTRVANKALTGGCYLTTDQPTADVPILKMTNFDDGTNQPLGIENPLKTIEFIPTNPAIGNILCMFCAINPGEWNNNLYIAVRPSGKNPMNFYVDVFLNYTHSRQFPIESFLVSRQREVTTNGDQLYIEDVINSTSQYIRVLNNTYLSNVKVLVKASEFIDGASNGLPVTNAQIISAWDLYADKEIVLIDICFAGGYTDVEVQSKINDICMERMDCVGLGDIPSDMQAIDDALYFKEYILNLDSSYYAVYTPDVLIYDKYNDFDVWLPLSFFAGVACAKVDNDGRRWYAPAGATYGTLNLVKRSRWTYDHGERDALDVDNINMLRFLPTEGFVIWGQSTCEKIPSSLTQLSVRRLVCQIERLMQVIALNRVFLPNDAANRLVHYNQIDSYLSIVKHSGGLYNYEVVCDESNNPLDIIARGDTVIDVYLDPTLAAKRIYINVIIPPIGVATFSVATSQI